MEDYYPSEIARLVLGYLDEVRCTKTWHTFLEESGNLQEHSNLLKHKKRCTTNVRGESLLDILKAYCALKSFFEQIICQYSWKDVLDDISYLQEQYNVHKQKSCYSTQRTGQSVVNSLREWISKISSTSSSGSEANQFLYTDLPYYPSYSSLISFKTNKENASQTDKNCQKTTDKNVQTDLLSCACLQKSEKKSARCVDTSEERSEYPENNVIDSTSDQGGTQNKLDYLNPTEQGLTQISESSKHCNSDNKHSSPESSSSFSRPSCLLNPEKDGRKELEKEKPPQGKNHQVKRNLFKDPSLSKNLHLSEAPVQLFNAENRTTKKATGQFVELPEVAKPIFDCPDSNYSSNIDSNVTEYADFQIEISSLDETNKYAGECTEIVPCDLSTKAAIKQISKINVNGDSMANIFALQEVPSDNNSSLLNSEHDLQIIESELDSHVSDSEMNAGDTSTVIPFNTSDIHPINNMPLEHSNTDNKLISLENNQSSQKEEEECTLNVAAQLSPLANSCHSVENTAAVTTDTEMIDKTETTNENPGFVVLSNEMNCQNSIVPSEKQGVCETSGNTTVNESHNVVKSTDDFILMNNSQYSTVISPPNQSNTVLSYTTIPEYTVPNISSDLQNNIQYQIVLNTPISWNVPIANALSLVPPQRLSFVPSLPLPNVSKPPVISPAPATVVPAPLLSNVPKQVAFAASSSTVVPLPSTASQISSSSTAVSSHIANFETVVSDNLHDKIKSVPVVKKTKTDPKKSKSSKQKANEKKNDKNESIPTAGKRPYSKRLPKRKRPSLFGSPPKPKEDPPAEKIPVLSITESPCKTSASNVITKITEDFADQCKSPVLKLLMTSAKEMLKTNNRASPSHVRCLDFNSKSTDSDEILIIDGNNKVQENNNSENVPEMLVRNDVQNSKSLRNGNAHNEQCTSKVTNKIPDCGENSKKRTINDTPSKGKKAKLQKQGKREKRTSKKVITPQKVKGKTKNSKSYKSPKKASKIQKVKFQENDTISIQDERKTSPRKNKTKCNKLLMSESNSDVAIIEENNTSPKKYNMTSSKKEGAERINVVSVSPKKCFQLKTYENMNKIKSHEILDAIKELHKKGSESQNEKVTQETVVTEAAERNKSPSKNNEVQNKKCTLELDETPRKSQRIANKMTVAACKEFPIGERKESHNKSSDHCKVNAVLDDKLSKVLQNTVSEYSKVEVTSTNHLSPLRNKENEYCKTKQNQKSPKKSDKLLNKKTENIDKNVIISLNEVNESFNLSDEATHSTPVGTPQKYIETISDDEDVTVIFENKKCQKTTFDKNYEILKDKNKTNISEKYSTKNYMEKNKETAFKNICNTSELNDINKDQSLKKGGEMQYTNKNNEMQNTRKGTVKKNEMQNIRKGTVKKNEMQNITKGTVKNNEMQNIRKGTVKNNEMQNIRKGTVKSKEMLVDDVTHKPQRENSIGQNITESNKLSENNQIPSCNANEKLRKNIEKAANKDVEKSDNFSKMIVFDNSFELKTILTNKNPDEEIEYPICNDINLGNDNFQLKRKIVFGDPDFKLQEVNNNEQIYLRDNSKISTLEESVMHLRDIKEAKEDFISSTSVSNSTTTNLQQQKYKKDFESNITCTTIINKRKMTHPKKRIKQNYLEAQDLRNSVQDTVEKIKHLASISPAAVSVLNSIKISNNSVKFNPSNLDLNCSKESNSKNMSNVSCSSVSNKKTSSLNIDGASKNKGINSVRDNEDISKNDDTDNVNTLKTSKPSVTTSKISEEVAIKSHFDFGNTENNLNEVNSLEDNAEEKLATDVLQISLSKQSENIELLEAVEGHFIAGKKCNLDTSTNDCNTGNLDSVKSVSLSPNSCNKQTNVDLSNHNSNDSFHSISSNSDEEVSSNMSSTIYNDAVESSLQIPKTVNYVSIDVGGISSTSVRGNNLCDTTSDPKNMPEKRKDTVSDSPMPAMKRICRKLSSSSDEICSSPSKSKTNKQKEKPNSNKTSTKGESLKLLGRNFVGKQNLNKKLKTVQDSPVRCLQKVKKVLPKTALGKRIVKDLRIPAGVKIPYKWNNSKIINYSNEICQSTKNTKKNVNKNMAIEVNEKEEGSNKKQILKPVEHKINKDKQNFVKELHEDCKPEPCVMLTRLSANDTPKMQCSLNSNAEDKIADQNILLHTAHQQIVEAIPEGNAGEITTNKPENSTLSHSIPSQSIMQHFETTQDMVEADIGRSNDEGSELSIAIKNCEKELFSSQSTRLSSSPEKLPPYQPEKETSHHESSSVDQPEKTASLPESNSTEQSEKKESNMENNAKLALIRSYVEKYGAECISQILDKLERENTG